MQRAIHLVMLLALLLSGPMLPPSASPCCAAAATPPAQHQAEAMDAMADMPSCHHAAVGTEASLSASNLDCPHNMCAMQRNIFAPQAAERPADAFLAAPARSNAAVAVTDQMRLPRQQRRPPSPPTAMPLPLRV